MLISISTFSDIEKCRLHVWAVTQMPKAHMKYGFFLVWNGKPHNPKVYFQKALENNKNNRHEHTMRTNETKIVDHKLWRCESARAVRKMSNRNQMTVPRCARHMTTLYWIILQFFETFSTPNEGGGSQRVRVAEAVSETTGRSTNASSSQCTQKTLLEHAITRASFYYSNVDTVEEKNGNREKATILK